MKSLLRVDLLISLYYLWRILVSITLFHILQMFRLWRSCGNILVSALCYSLLEHWYHGVSVTISSWSLLRATSINLHDLWWLVWSIEHLGSSSLDFYSWEYYLATSTCFGLTLKISSITVMPTLFEKLDLR